MTDRTGTRRGFLRRLGAAAGASAVYDAMRTLGHAAESDFTRVPPLAKPDGRTSVAVLGAGLAGLVASYELSRAGYDVTVLEYQARIGGRNITLRGGDRLVEMGSPAQDVHFAPGNYFNPGPWRIPYHHAGLLHYCATLGVALEPFVETNYNSLLHSAAHFGGRPQRYRDVAVDYAGYTAELLTKAINTQALETGLSRDERRDVLQALRLTGALDPSGQYHASDAMALTRGYAKEPGAGENGAPVPSRPLPRGELMASGLWQAIAFHQTYEMQTTMFQPAGGMDMISRAFIPHVGHLVRLKSQVAAIRQDEHGVSVDYTRLEDGTRATLHADFCICALPLPILDQLSCQVSSELKAAIGGIAYHSSVKIGLEFRRRFWEQDDAIYGGISFTDQTISQISYPSHGYLSRGPGVLLGGYMFGESAMYLAGMTPAERIALARKEGAAIHPQYDKEFSNGVSIAWSRVPWTLGCCSNWSDQARQTHYRNLVRMDRRVVLAGEHASYVGCWQEGAVLSALNAVTQVNARAHGGQHA
ncbi:flavin monoamine oxidase family protein [Tanticharoenia sakaeratensis]|uniref:Tryptophan 2-monooxygenase n=1 Tax=Tanticharoenia sakaeratensis NBRC 103193 TaxID=1231623 RepID=A0A0D6MGK4_9PROT|nr:flavin monoamine oxidase family protein [Tanticharoenia sakaeratensis]GAN52754.1 L-amino-acid oxidase [Tanticharoenia sakaeratensis NBRC 103193]GBQ17920.1 flavin-containing amine oxidase [Tanticharoenia sakaeratensis NBRC 103193]